MFLRNSNNPTRAEYFDLLLELNIDHLSDLIKKGTVSVNISSVVKLLKELREEVNWKFADDEELDALMKLYDPKLAPKKTGPKPGSKRSTKQNDSFIIFRKKYPRSKDFKVYESFCDEMGIGIGNLKGERYKDEESFKDRLKREKKESVINFTLIPTIST